MRSLKARILLLAAFLVLAGVFMLYSGNFAGVVKVFASNLDGADSEGSSGEGMPGSASDPLIARSAMEEYVNEQFNLRLPEFMENAVKPFVEESVGEKVKELGWETGTAGQWAVVELKKGQRLVGGAGAEIIVRTGQAAVVDPTPNGIPDLTSGSNLTAGKVVPNNHLFIIPRDDGRGIQALSSSVWVMYKGQANIYANID